MRYQKIKSEFIKEKIKGLSWDKRKYINDLVKLERFILHGVGSYASAMLFNSLKGHYKGEFHQIYGELKPKEFSNYLREQGELEKKLRKEENESEAIKKAGEKILKKEWLALGGRLG